VALVHDLVRKAHLGRADLRGHIIHGRSNRCARDDAGATSRAPSISSKTRLNSASYAEATRSSRSRSYRAAAIASWTRATRTSSRLPCTAWI
jgi:hypothetical protein